MKKKLTKAELEKLPTPRLLAYKKSLPYPGYDTGGESVVINKARGVHMQEVKDVLSKRGHVERKPAKKLAKRK